MSQFQVLLTPVVALMCLTFLFGLTLRHFQGRRSEQLAFGLMFGGVIIWGMTNPITLGEGIIFDTRTLLIAAAVAFVGPLTGAIALGIGLACRIYLGGAGMAAGVLGLVMAYVIAWLWCRFAQPRITNPILADAGLGLTVTSSVVAVFVLPVGVALGILNSILPPLIVCNILGAIAIGALFRRELRHHEMAKALEAAASVDPLTNLLNRRGLDRRVNTGKFDASNGHATLYFDLDDFKSINDLFGHDAGDAALTIVAARINDNLRSNAIFARQGGDEFSIYMPDLAKHHTQGVADRLCRLVAQDKIKHNGVEFSAAISMGVYWTDKQMPLQQMIDRADAQLLLAKRAGKNRAQIHFDHGSQDVRVA